MKIKFINYIIVLAALVSALSGCDSNHDATAQDAGAGPQAAQVELAEVKAAPFARTVELPGRISPCRVAEVRARVPGILLSRDFEEGSDVKKGQMLFHIEPASLEAVLAEAKADLAQAEATLRDKSLTARRYAALAKSKSASQQQYDNAMADYKVAEAVKKASQAKVKTAALNLSYASVEAPISGRAGRAQVTEGALVGQNEATHLVTIQQLDPIYADINQPVADYLKLKAAMHNGEEGEESGAKVTVEVEEVGYRQQGKLLFSDVTVDRNTGQVGLRSLFPNPDGMLLPGMFVRIKIDLGTDNNAIFIPQRAVMHAADGTAQVYVQGAGGVAEVRKINTGQMVSGRWQVLKGLQPGEMIVVNGVDKVQPGIKLASAEHAVDSSAASAVN